METILLSTETTLLTLSIPLKYYVFENIIENGAFARLSNVGAFARLSKCFILHNIFKSVQNFT